MMQTTLQTIAVIAFLVAALVLTALATAINSQVDATAALVPAILFVGLVSGFRRNF